MGMTLHDGDMTKKVAEHSPGNYKVENYLRFMWPGPHFQHICSL